MCLIILAQLRVGIWEVQVQEVLRIIQIVNRHQKQETQEKVAVVVIQMTDVLGPYHVIWKMLNFAVFF